MQIELLGKQKIGFISGTFKKSSYNTKLQEQWKACNTIVLSQIMNTVSKNILSGIIYASIAYFVWEDLKESFDKVNRVRIWKLHREITMLMQDTNSIYIYILQN